MWGSVLLRAKSDLDFKFWSRVAMRARAWFNSTRTDPGSFLFVCTITGLDPDAVRERLKEKL